MATGGFKPNAATDFLEEWKAKREKMRAKMLGDIAAATGTALTTGNTNNAMKNYGGANADSNNKGSGETSHPVPVLPVLPVSAHPGAPIPAPTQTQAPIQAPIISASQQNSVKKGPTDSEGFSEGKEAPPSSSTPSSSSSRVRGDKKSCGPSARKGKGQIEKRKLREKRRSTGVVSIPSSESLDELEDDDVAEKDRREEEQLVQANTCQNEAMTVDPTTGHLLEIPRPEPSRHKSAAVPCAEEEEARGREEREEDSAVTVLERRLQHMEKELQREREQNEQLLKAHQEKDELIVKLKEEVDLLNRELDDIEDENDQLKQENKTLLKVVGQLTR